MHQHKFSTLKKWKTTTPTSSRRISALPIEDAGNQTTKYFLMREGKTRAPRKKNSQLNILLCLSVLSVNFSLTFSMAIFLCSTCQQYYCPRLNFIGKSQKWKKAIVKGLIIILVELVFISYGGQPLCDLLQPNLLALFCTHTEPQWGNFVQNCS